MSLTPFCINIRFDISWRLFLDNYHSKWVCFLRKKLLFSVLTTNLLWVVSKPMESDFPWMFLRLPEKNKNKKNLSTFQCGATSLSTVTNKLQSKKRKIRATITIFVKEKNMSCSMVYVHFWCTLSNIVLKAIIWINSYLQSKVKDKRRFLKEGKLNEDVTYDLAK
jgi:hypothetical protein